MQKFIVSGALVATVLVSPLVAVAQESDEGETIETLRERVAELEQYVLDLEDEVRTWRSHAQSTLPSYDSIPVAVPSGTPRVLIRALDIGMTGDDVRMLQEALAKDPSVYPEGLVTGYYGPMTDAALMRLKARHQIGEEGVTLGPKMLAFLNQWLESHGASILPPAGSLRNPASSQMDPRVQELLNDIRQGKRGEELRTNWKRISGDSVDGTDGTDGEDGEAGTGY